jgi:hypothetical protein
MQNKSKKFPPKFDKILGCYNSGECHGEGDIYFDVTLGLYEAKYDGEHVVHRRGEH